MKYLSRENYVIIYTNIITCAKREKKEGRNGKKEQRRPAMA